MRWATVAFYLAQSIVLTGAQPFLFAFWEHLNVLGDQSCSIGDVTFGLVHLQDDVYTNGQNWYEILNATLPPPCPWCYHANYCDAGAFMHSDGLNGRRSVGQYDGTTDLGYPANDLDQQIDKLLDAEENVPFLYYGVTVIHMGMFDVLYDRDLSEIIADLTAGLTRLDEASLRNIAIFNLPPLYDFPVMDQSWFNTDWTDAAGARTYFSTQVSLYNSMLSAAVDTFMQDHEYADIRIVDQFSLYEDAIANPADYGYTNVVDACVPDVRRPMCDPVTDYLFLDIYDVEAAFHQHIADLVLELFEDCWSVSQPSITSAPTFLTERAVYRDEILYLSVGIPSNYFDVKFFYEGVTPAEPAFMDDGALPYREDRIAAGETIDDYYWVNNNEGCLDVYTSTVPWGTLLDGAANLVREDDVVAPLGLWTGTSLSGVLYSTSKEYVGVIRSSNIYSEVSSRYPFTVIFPTGVEVLSGGCEEGPPPANGDVRGCNITEILRVYDNENVLSIVVAQYIISTEVSTEQEVSATVDIWTSVQWPFILVPSDTVSSVPEIDNPSLTTTEYDHNEECEDPAHRFPDDDEPRPDPCTQKFHIDMKPNEGLTSGQDTFVCELDGLYEMTFDLVCQPNMTDNCPIDDQVIPVTYQFTLDSESWCAVVEFGVAFTGIITAYRDAARTTIAQAEDFLPDFKDYDDWNIWHRNIIYFQVQLLTEEHVIQRTELVTIEITTSGNTKALLLNGLNYAQLVGWAQHFLYWNDVTPANGEDPRTVCWFEFNLDPAILTIPDDDHILAKIDVVLRVFYENLPSKLMSVTLFEQQTSAEETISAEFTIQIPDEDFTLPPLSGDDGENAQDWHPTNSASSLTLTALLASIICSVLFL